MGYPQRHFEKHCSGVLYKRSALFFSKEFLAFSLWRQKWNDASERGADGVWKPLALGLTMPQSSYMVL